MHAATMRGQQSWPAALPLPCSAAKREMLASLNSPDAVAAGITTPCNTSQFKGPLDGIKQRVLAAAMKFPAAPQEQLGLSEWIQGNPQTIFR